MSLCLSDQLHQPPSTKALLPIFAISLPIARLMMSFDFWSGLEGPWAHRGTCSPRICHPLLADTALPLYSQAQMYFWGLIPRLTSIKHQLPLDQVSRDAAGEPVKCPTETSAPASGGSFGLWWKRRFVLPLQRPKLLQ